MRHKKNRQNQGFTLVELVIAIIVIGILATLSVIGWGAWRERVAETEVKSDISGVMAGMENHRNFNNGYPSLDEGTEFDGSNNSSDIFRSSEGVRLTYVSGDDKAYCVEAQSLARPEIVYSYSTTGNGSAVKGVCAEGEDTTPPGPIIGGELTCDTGYIPVPGNSLFGTSDFCVMKYEAKNVGGVATSQASGTPWTSISQTDAITAANDACGNCHLITEAEWLTIAHNVVNVAGNWSGGSVGSGYIYSGHNDRNPFDSLAASTNDDNGYEGTGNSSGNQRRTLTLSNGEVIWDLAGNVDEWTSGQTSGAGSQPGGSGYDLREWNSISINTLSPNPFPHHGTAGASSWTSNNGIGLLNSSSSDAALRGFLRGGNWSYSSIAGVFMLNLGASPSMSGTSIGFRVAHD